MSTLVTALVGIDGNISVSAPQGAISLKLNSALINVNSVTSAVGQTFTIGTGSFGAAVVFASSTGIPTFNTSIAINGSVNIGIGVILSMAAAATLQISGASAGAIALRYIQGAGSSTLNGNLIDLGASANANMTFTTSSQTGDITFTTGSTPVIALTLSHTAQAATLSGVTTITSATASTSVSTGALVLNGASAGLGVAGAAWIGGLINVGSSATVGTQLIFPSGTTNAVGVNFNSDTYLYRQGAATVALTSVSTSTSPFLTFGINGVADSSAIGEAAATSAFFLDAVSGDVCLRGNNGKAVRIGPTGGSENSSSLVITPSVSTFSGNIVVPGSVINASDSRLKSGITTLTSGLDLILKLNPVSYRLNTDPTGRTSYGLIAQEVASTLATTGRAHVGIVEHDLVADRYGLSYTQFIAPLIRGEQELYARIVELEAQVAALNRGEHTL